MFLGCKTKGFVFSMVKSANYRDWILVKMKEVKTSASIATNFKVGWSLIFWYLKLEQQYNNS